MERKGPQVLTGPELNAAVYRYLLESGFVHSGFNFFYEAGIEKGNIYQMIPQGALIRIVQKGLQYIELEANSEIGSDDEYHFLDTLDLMTNDVEELRKKIASSAKLEFVKNDNDQIDSVETDKAQKIYSVGTDSAQKIGSAETTRMSRKKPVPKMKAVQNNNPDETAIMRRTQLMKHILRPMKRVKAQGIDSKEQNISSAKIAQKVGSAKTSVMYKKKPMQKTKAVQNSSPDQTAAVRRTGPMKHAKTQGTDSKEQNITAAETAQKISSVEATTGQASRLSWIGKKPRLQKRKH